MRQVDGSKCSKSLIVVNLSDGILGFHYAIHSIFVYV